MTAPAAPSPGPRGPASPVAVLVLLVVSTGLAHVAFNGSRLAISLNALGLGASPWTVGVLMSLFAALPMLLAVPAGRLVDRVGVRGPMLAGGAGLVAATALPLAWPGLASLHVAAAIAGVAFMLLHMGGQHAVGEMSSPEDRKANFGWLALGFSVSNVTGPTVTGYCIDAVGYRLTFGVLAAFALAGAAWLFLRRRELPAPRPAHERAARRNTWELVRLPDLRRAFIVTAVLGSAWDLFVFVMPIYGTSIGLSASTIGLVMGSFAFATFLIRLVLPWISRHLGEWQVIAATMAIACTAYALFPLVRTVPLLAAIAFLLGLGLGATQPSVMSLIYAAAPPGRGAEAVGVRAVVLNASHTFLPLAFGAVGAALGVSPIFWSMSAALAAGGWHADKQRRKGRGA